VAPLLHGHHAHRVRSGAAHRARDIDGPGDLDPASGNPVIEFDPRWYEFVGFDAWRDPWVLRDPGGNGFHALITARARTGELDARGVIGHAWSPT